MNCQWIETGDHKIPVYAIETIVIGSGCAGFNAADCLYDFGKRDMALLTEGINRGTSRNAGSDKQTYYKLSLASDGADSVQEMAETLFSGGGVNGDTALAEAAGSVRSFMKLVHLGVPFPANIYGEYVGYKTDHDPRSRATSAGPLTSRYMTECLQRSVESKGIKIFDNMQVIKLLVENDRVRGALAVDLENLENGSFGLTLFRSSNVIMATGGPAGVYHTSVYPESQTGSAGLALEAGAGAANLQEWQYGLASVKFRWNVSGTYQQVLPRYISVDRDGNEREFLPGHFDNPCRALDMVFLKGYQWPFDVAKVKGSSYIDILVHDEIKKGNRVYMDFTREPSGLENGFDGLSEVTRGYLENSGALIPLPINRLAGMNAGAIELFRNNGIDLYSKPLEVAVCAQHNNGGIAVDINWQSSIGGLYAAGEAAGTFGVYRPGGSALNSSQVGSMRAAEHIAFKKPEEAVPPEQFRPLAEQALEPVLKLIKDALWRGSRKSPCCTGNSIDPQELLLTAQKRMSAYASHIRDLKEIGETDEFISGGLESFAGTVGIGGVDDIPGLFKARDILIAQRAVLSAIGKSAAEIGSRGSALVLGRAASDGKGSGAVEPAQAPSSNGAGAFDDRLIITRSCRGGFASEFRPVRPIPVRDGWFENVWREYRERIKNT